MLRLTIFVTAMFAIAHLASAQSLDDQLSSLKQAQDDIKVEQARKEAEAKRIAEERAARERAAEEKRYQEQQKAQKEREAREKARSEKLEASERARNEKLEQEAKLQREETQKDKSRAQSYEDELRQLEIEEKRIHLSEKKARAARTDDFIDQELNREKAKTDVIQSDADSSRNYSEGSRDMMRGVGTGAANGNLTKREINNTTVEKTITEKK